MSQAFAAALLHQHQAPFNRLCLQVAYQDGSPKRVDYFAPIGSNRKAFLPKSQRRADSLRIEPEVNNLLSTYKRSRNEAATV